MNADQRSVFQKAAFSILSGDQAKAASDPKLGEQHSGGGQKLAGIRTIDVTADGDVVLTHEDGRKATETITSEGIFTPSSRNLAPADVHDAVLAAAMQAAAQLAVSPP